MNVMMKTNVLETKRLVLRPLELRDAPLVERYGGDRRVAEMTSQIPFPYPVGSAEGWIEECQREPRNQGGGPMAITLKLGGELVGCIELNVHDDGLRAEVGYWVAPLFWGYGLCTEALQGVVDHGFEELGLQRIYAGHFPENPASGRVQAKVGMKKEGVLRLGVTRFGVAKDLVMRAITRPDWEVGRS